MYSSWLSDLCYTSIIPEYFLATSISSTTSIQAPQRMRSLAGQPLRQRQEHKQQDLQNTDNQYGVNDACASSDSQHRSSMTGPMEEAGVAMPEQEPKVNARKLSILQMLQVRLHGGETQSASWLC